MIDLMVYRNIQSCKRFGYKKSIISEHLGISRNTLNKFWDMSYEDFRDSFYQKNKLAAIALYERIIRKWVIDNRTISALKVRDMLYEDYNVYFSERTVSRFLERLRWEYRNVIRKK